MTVAIWFAHGKESGPWGRKITLLSDIARERGLHVESPDYGFTMDPDRRVEHLVNQSLPAGKRLILAGSSMGGYVSAVASRTLRPRALFLMAPAVDVPGYEADTTPGTDQVEVVHGWRDEVIPVDRVVAWCRRHESRLHVLPCGHTLNDQLEDVASLFRAFLDRVTADS